MRRRTATTTRVLPDGTPLRNRLLAALPALEYDGVAQHLRVRRTTTGDTLHEQGRRVNNVYFPNGGVFSITTRLRDGSLVEVATVGREGMLGIGAFLGDRAGAGRTFQQVADGPLAVLAVSPFVKETAESRTFRELMARYAQATLLQTMQCTACNARHAVKQPLLPLAAGDARLRGRRRFPDEARLPGDHARRPPSHRHDRAG